MTEPLGLTFVMRVYMDSDHAGESVTRQSHSGYIFFLNSAPIYWLSENQMFCETITFKREFFAMKNQWNTPVGFDTSSGCLEFQLLNLHLSMGIISRCCVTRLRRSQPWRRNQMKLRFTLWGRDVHKMSGEQNKSMHTSMLPTLWQNHLQGSNDGSLCRCCNTTSAT